LNNNTINLSLLGTQAAGTYTVDIFRFFSNAGTTATTHAFSSGLTIGTLGAGIDSASIDWNGTGNDSQTIALTYTVIPEPHVALLGGLGLLLLLRRY
jgi:galactitol-specific phosphotransferase system IIC component